LRVADVGKTGFEKGQARSGFGGQGNAALV